MKIKSKPRNYDEWRTHPSDRVEDAAYIFGYDLIRYCREEALASINMADLQSGQEEILDVVEQAVDISLHNVMDLLEGFFSPKTIGTTHTAEYSLVVQVRDQNGSVVEKFELSPKKSDLSVGYWKWQAGEFQ